jgi:NAD(P)-dependent dehydrogenase (short-subunit alcohol dehydrogenase family)
VSKPVMVVIGTGGMGAAIARRLGTGHTILLADFDRAKLDPLAEELTGTGYDVRASFVDVSKPESVAELAAEASAAGPVAKVVHTAGLSPVQAPVAAILAVDLVGVARVLDEFGTVVAPGGAGIVIASMAGHMAASLTPEQEVQLAMTPVDQLLALPFLQPEALPDAGAAYGIAKRANQLRVRAAAPVWGDRGARVNCISPGIIATPMGMQELAGPSGQIMNAMIAVSAAGRLGTPEDIAAAAAYLLDPQASFVTGIDLLVDGGVVAALRAGRLGG